MKGVSRVGTGSPRGEGKDLGAEPRRLRPLLPLMLMLLLPLPRGSRCRRGRVLGIAATGAQRSPLAQRLSAGTPRAGLVTRLWVHVNTAGRSPALPPPNHRGWRAGGGAGSWPVPSAPAAPARPPAPAPAPAPHVRRGRRRRRCSERALGRACGCRPLSLRAGQALTPDWEASATGRDGTGGGHPLVGVPHPFPEQRPRSRQPCSYPGLL